MKAIKYIISTLVASSLLFSACTTVEPIDPDQPNWDTPVASIGENNKVIYEVNVRNFSKSGDFNGLRAELGRLNKMGVDVLWLMPIHPIGVEKRSGTMGSPYSVKDFKAINPDYGTNDDFKNLIKDAHDMQMEIWIDWVANHTAWDNSWITEHPEYYAKKGGKPYAPVINDIEWSDVAQLKMTALATQDAMIDAMKYWVSEFNIDGFRCDYASSPMIPATFWSKARTEIDAIKEVKWMCEADCETYYDDLLESFDYDYAWGFNDRLSDFATNGDLESLRQNCSDLFNNDRYSNGKSRMVYLTNHDLNADKGSEFSRFGTKLKALTVLYFTIYDMPLLYNGQEVGDDQQMGLFTKESVIWNNSTPEIETLIKKLSRLKRTTPALSGGSERGSIYIYPTDDMENIFAFQRKKGDSEVLVLLNFSSKSVSAQFAGNQPIGDFKNYLDGGTVNFANDPRFTLPANGYAVYLKKN